MPSIEYRGAGLTVATSNGDRVVLAPTSLELTERRIGIVGANGSGKSTLARMLNGLVVPTAGQVLVDGLDVAKYGAKVRQQVAFCFTDPAAQLVMPTCVEDVELSLRRHEKNSRRRRERALEVLARFGLGEHAEVSVHALSGGQKQLLALAGVLATEPTVLVADEPTTLLDLANTRRVTELLFDLEQQLVLVTHDLELAARCDRVIVVEDARVRFDGPADAAVADYLELGRRMSSPVLVGVYQPGTSLLHRLPVGVKLGGLAVLSLTIVLVRSMPASLVFFALTLGLALVRAGVGVDPGPRRARRACWSRWSSAPSSGG